MIFWEIAFMRKWIDVERLKLVVKTENNPYGEITVEEYKEITGIEYVA